MKKPEGRGGAAETGRGGRRSGEGKGGMPAAGSREEHGPGSDSELETIEIAQHLDAAGQREDRRRKRNQRKDEAEKKELVNDIQTMVAGRFPRGIRKLQPSRLPYATHKAVEGEVLRLRFIQGWLKADKSGGAVARSKYASACAGTLRGVVDSVEDLCKELQTWDKTYT